MKRIKRGPPRCKVAHTDGPHLFTRRSRKGSRTCVYALKKCQAEREVGVIRARAAVQISLFFVHAVVSTTKGRACVEKPFIAVLTHIPMPPTPDQACCFLPLGESGIQLPRRWNPQQFRIS